MHFRILAAWATVSALALFSFCPGMPTPAQTTVTSAAGQVPAPEQPAGSGPYKAVMEADPSLTTHTIYQPCGPERHR